MLPKEDRRAMLLRLYNDDSPLLDSSKDRFNNKQNGDVVEDEAADENSVVDGDSTKDSVAPSRPEKEEEGVGIEDEDEDDMMVEDEAVDHPKSVT